MTLTAPLRATVVALLALAATLTGCGNPLEPASPAPSTWAIPTDTAALPATQTTTAPQPTAAPADDPTLDTTRPLATDPAGPTDIPTATAEISNPTYDINNIDRTDPAQVAWAYLIHRLSHSYTDPAPGAGLTAAAQYATSELGSELSDEAAAAANTWADQQATHGTAMATLTHLSVYTDHGQTAVIATWTLTVSTREDPPRTTANLSTTLALAVSSSNWTVVADGVARPD